ncbi:YdeI/OmpD-associated family protein [Pyxidicoccus trucidator]|uniref:YdeI/OmpD-associated family protein n=1 Tax=Pyxidicoccus trucidator TaxID=2709662 RepID=UPI0013D9E1B5|nr:YdeI/OmpD-associated family protein [Pyxidicoccus trucidator]
MPATKKAPEKKAVVKKAPAKELPIVPFESQRAWETWLAANHASSRGVWLKLAKKSTGVASVTYPEALDVALAWGWIDGQKGSFDDAWWLQKFTPRGAKSVWSKVNREKVQALVDAGKMQPSGLAVVESAKQDGRWEAAYDSQSKATVPEDLATALAANARASAYFATLNAANRYAILWRVHTAKKAETRARRIADFVEMLARNEKLHP